ncbi:hypothetical protein CBM2634_U280002 [Cupriavidus taiwanensis]|uniref:Uncharacterized protein n=1 Tax=Cupriavidus taiwanensis TaxID=164546 RepID=A0A375JC31_9BURK|nr:hypothetical protein CBM2634_U280002 [Cupriavidus taiwanensis]
MAHTHRVDLTLPGVLRPDVSKPAIADPAHSLPRSLVRLGTADATARHRGGAIAPCGVGLDVDGPAQDPR